ncbi:uncharacterized protein LOC105194131 isoform X4 [Solenopsis invicta]|uniref:uncharacterized protein LOC105194131 isoform X4 n=1 Tax=Solenopsis invicta TaxID=13686 RepID=UPI00193CFFD9|nr:uncharacterized protein LOC105194131 isoform X4 [Solenopsis invicta]
MGGCAAPFCNNSAAKGYVTKIFPRNIERRALWIKNVSERCWGNGVKNWTPATNSHLCEVHFPPEMWEPRTDVRKLKSSAYPTIFGYFLKKKPTENNARQVLTKNIKVNNKADSNESYQPINVQVNKSVTYIQKQKNQVINDISKCNTSSAINPASTSIVKSIEPYQPIDDFRFDQPINDIVKQEYQFEQPVDDIVKEEYQFEQPVEDIVKEEYQFEQPVDDIVKEEYQFEQPVDDIVKEEYQFEQPVNNIVKQEYQAIDDTSETSILCPTTCSDECNEREEMRYKKLEDIIRRQQLKMFEMLKEMKSLKDTIYILKNKHNNDKYKKALESVFTDCQIKALFAEKRCVRMWSHDTIKRALQLKFACGTNGYEELIRQGYPLPNLRTLQRKIKFQF